MEKDNTVHQQRQCILDDYQSIIEDPESYAYPNIEEHMSEFIADIKGDIEQVFECHIDTEKIKNILHNYNNE